MTRRRLLQELDHDELVHWEEFCGIEPFGDEWRQAMSIKEGVYFGAGVKKKGGGEFTVDDLMPIPKPARKKQTAKQMEAVLVGLFGPPLTSKPKK